jgi:hypothetical protein
VNDIVQGRVTRMSHIEHPATLRTRIDTHPASTGRKRLMRHVHGALVVAAFIFVTAGILGLFN